MNHAPTHESFSDLVSCGPTKKPFHCFCSSAFLQHRAVTVKTYTRQCKWVRFWLPLLVKTPHVFSRPFLQPSGGPSRRPLLECRVLTLEILVLANAGFLKRMHKPSVSVA